MKLWNLSASSGILPYTYVPFIFFSFRSYHSILLLNFVSSLELSSRLNLTSVATIPSVFSEIDTTFCYYIGYRLYEYVATPRSHWLGSRNSGSDTVYTFNTQTGLHWHFIRLSTYQYALVSDFFDWAATVETDRRVHMSKLSSETSYLGQSWMFTPLSDGTYHIMNNNSGFNRLTLSPGDAGKPCQMPINVDFPVPNSRQWILNKTEIRARTLNAPLLS